MLVIHEALGNHSHILKSFTDSDSLSEWLEDRVRNDIRENETAEDIEADEDSLRELYFSYYSIEEITAETIEERAKQIMDSYTVQEILKGDNIQMHMDAWEQARKEFTA